MSNCFQEFRPAKTFGGYRSNADVVGEDKLITLQEFHILIPLNSKRLKCVVSMAKILHMLKPLAAINICIHSITSLLL